MRRMVEGRRGSAVLLSQDVRFAHAPPPAFGWFLLACGLFITLFMGWITWSLLPTLLHPQHTIEGTSFSGTKDEAQLILGLFGVIILFGLVGTANALYMITTGRQSRWFVIVTLLLAVAIIAAAWLATRTLK